MSDACREGAEDAAEDYSDDAFARHHFARGWVEFCEGIPLLWFENQAYRDGYIAARDAPE